MPKVQPNAARKIRLYPTSEQRTVLLEWLHSARATYNMAVAALRRGQRRLLRRRRRARARGISDANIKKTIKDPLTAKRLRDACVSDAAVRDLGREWLKRTPWDVRDAAALDLLKACKSGWARFQKDSKPFRIGFRSRKDAVWSLTLHKKHVKTQRNALSPYAAHRGKLGVDDQPIRTREPLPSALPSDARLLLDTRVGHWWLCFGEHRDVADEHQVRDIDEATLGHSVVALDPGVRTFMTGYDADGRVLEWGANDFQRIVRLAHASDRLDGKAAKASLARQSRSLRTAAARVRQRIRNLVDDLHRRLAAHLARDYRVVLLPDFRAGQMVRRATRRIRSKTARAMLTWSHSRFRERLLHKASLHGALRVYVCDERCTSKTCGRCGAVHATLGGAKTFRCPAPGCGYVADRDANAARNILVRFLCDHAHMCA